MKSPTLPPPAEPVHNGVAEQLARIAHFRTLELAQPEELDAVAHFLIGNVGTPVDRILLWNVLQEDCDKLWSLITADWDTDDLDDIPEDDWARQSFATWQQEEDHRYQITRDRLTADIERAIYLARYAATQARRQARIAS